MFMSVKSTTIDFTRRSMLRSKVRQKVRYDKGALSRI